MIWGAILYHERSNLLRIEGNLDSNRYIHEMLQPEVVSFLQGIPGAVLQQGNAHPHVARLLETSVQPNTCNFFLGLLSSRICRLLSTTATAGSDVVQFGRPIFDYFFQHLWPYIGNNTANVVFQMVKRLWIIRIDQ
ncbi:uncharacterized protein TNCV_773441 [Trichonephila clavipes]|nr:uncharacterized protein TNCV_773441 [Trichonephila clavipes]